ncbi:hypothetical protein AALA52_09405 [Lactococcus ileimucosae]|uniref:Uncharacterized protein n=1 Tax=Lactococcus ileimucosae TaxID=2941329 RepID=A0ABV4D806_9LACT
MLKRLMLSIAVLLSVFCASNAPNHAFASTVGTPPSSQSNENTDDALPIGTPLLFRDFDYDNKFLGYLGLTVHFSWDSRPWDYLYIGTYEEMSIEDAGHGKFYIRAGKPTWDGYDYVAITGWGYMYLGTKEQAETFTITSENDPVNPNQKLYNIFDSKFRGVGVYGKYVTVGKGTVPTSWQIIPQP